MALPREHLLDELATAYAQGVAAMAGATIAVSRRDYGVDGTLKHVLQTDQGQFAETGFPVDFQLKGTTTIASDNNSIAYDLKARNFNLIVNRSPSAAPYYLFLVCFDQDPNQWIVQSPERLILAASAYWWTQSGGGSDNTSTVRIRIPASQILSASSLENILNAAEQRFAP